MKEIFGGFPTAQKQEQISRKPDSKFGDSAQLLEMMARLQPHILGSAQDVLKTNPYTNQVDVIEFKDPKNPNQNEARVVSFDSKVDGTVYGIFKPQSGEQLGAKSANGFRHDQDLFPREAAAYLVSKHFDIDLVPPTLTRDIEGEIGSVQLLLDPAQYLTLSQMFRDRLNSTIENEWIDYLAVNDDTDALAAFDYIIAGQDRHLNNIMIQGGSGVPENELNDNLNLAAIDNGYSFNSVAFQRAETMYGPLVMRTTASEPDAEKLLYKVDRGGEKRQYNVTQDVPEWLMEKLKDGYRRREELATEYMILAIGRGEMSAMWERTEDIIKSGVFVSPLNLNRALGY